MSAPEPTPRLRSPMDRRAAIKWILTAAASVALLDRTSSATTDATSAVKPPATGYGRDPDLLKEYKPSEFWPLTFSEKQRVLAAALCDVIIPADAKSPSASALGVHDFIDEWISAPYPGHDADRKLVLEGLEWLDAESQRRFQLVFTDTIVSQKRELCDDICHVPTAKPELKTAAQFFTRFRELTAGGFYTTPEGMKDIGYVGNVPLTAFAGPPSEALRQLGLG